MAFAYLPLESQSIYDGGGSPNNSGRVIAGYDFYGTYHYASALRFAFPLDFGGNAETIHGAILRLYATVWPTGGGSKIRCRVGVLDGPQVLPTTNSGVESGPIVGEYKTIGTGVYSPALDYTITTTKAWVSIDIKAMLQEAQSDSLLGSGYVVIRIQDWDTEDRWLDADGIATANKPTLELTYGAAPVTGPPSRSLLADHTLEPTGLMPKGLLP